MSTAWPPDTEPSRRFPLYTRGNVGEVFPHVITVLTGTLVGDAVRAAQNDVLAEIGVLSRAERREATAGTGVFGGYLYANASVFRLMGVRAPGMSVADADAQVTGLIGDLPPYRRRPGDRNALATLQVGRYLGGVLRTPDLASLDVARADARAWLAAMPPLASASDDELWHFVTTYPARLAASMKRLLLASFVAAGPRALIDRALDRPAAPAGLANRLVAGVGDVDSAQPATALWALSRLIRDDAALTAAYDAGADGIEARLTGSALAAPLHDFLARFGHRGNDEYELATPAWVMDPRPVHAALDRLRLVPDTHDPAQALRRVQADRAHAEVGLRQSVGRLRHRFVRRALVSARLGAIARERAKDVLVLENLGARTALHELCRRVAERGGPHDVRRAFCVTVDEFPDFIAAPQRFADVIEARAARARYLDEREPPMWFEDTIPDPSTWPLRADRSTPTAQSTWTGIGVSAGRASGRARVVTDPADPRGLEPGDVLVCHITDPSWTPLFLVAAAVVCETGAMQSHAAIVARELGIPAVVSVDGITALRDGTAVDVDADLGVVRIAAT